MAPDRTEEATVRTAYQALAGAIAALVALQAMLAVYAVVAPTGVAQETAGHEHTHGHAQGHGPEPGEVARSGGANAHDLHAAIGHYLVPLLVLALVAVAAFAGFRWGLRLAALVAGATALQIAAGVLSHRLPEAGLVHGLNAFLLFSLAAWAVVACRAREQEPRRQPNLV